MVGGEDRFDPLQPRFRRQAEVAGNDRAVGDFRDQAFRLQRPIAVDHQARIDLPDHGGVQQFADPAGDGAGADVQGDVACEIRITQAQPTQAERDIASCVITNQDMRR